MAVVARFYCASITTTKWTRPPSRPRSSLQAATRGQENKVWATATPVGKVTMTINNSAAGQWFRDHLGKDVAITFDDAPEPEA